MEIQRKKEEKKRKVESLYLIQDLINVRKKENPEIKNRHKKNGNIVEN